VILSDLAKYPTTQVSHGLSATAELLVITISSHVFFRLHTKHVLLNTVNLAIANRSRSLSYNSHSGRTEQ